MVQDREVYSIPRLQTFIFVNLKSTVKDYRSKRSAGPIDIINDKKLKEKQIDILRAISKHINLIRL